MFSFSSSTAEKDCYDKLCSLGKSERHGIASITDARTQIELAIEDSPSLKNYPTEQLEESYQRARHQAAKQTNIQISVFLKECPYPVEFV